MHWNGEQRKMYPVRTRSTPSPGSPFEPSAPPGWCRWSTPLFPGGTEPRGRRRTADRREAPPRSWTPGGWSPGRRRCLRIKGEKTHGLFPRRRRHSFEKQLRGLSGRVHGCSQSSSLASTSSMRVHSIRESVPPCCWEVGQIGKMNVGCFTTSQLALLEPLNMTFSCIWAAGLLNEVHSLNVPQQTEDQTSCFLRIKPSFLDDESSCSLGSKILGIKNRQFLNQSWETEEMSKFFWWFGNCRWEGIVQDVTKINLKSTNKIKKYVNEQIKRTKMRQKCI